MKKERDKSRVLCVLIQCVIVFLWFWKLSQFELYSKEGYRYNKFDGIYMLCACIAVFGMWNNLGKGIPLSRKKSILAAVAAIIYSLATVMANYPVFDPFGEIANLMWFLCTLVGGFLVGFNILVYALRRLPLITAERKGERNHPLRVFLLSFGSIASIYLLYFFCVAYPGYFTRDSFTAVRECVTGVYDNTSPFWHTMVVKLCLEAASLFGGQGNSAVCVYGIVQCLAMAASFAYAVMTLYQTGIPKWCVGMVWGMYALVSYNVAYGSTLWKDVPFSMAALVMVTALCRILKGIGRKSAYNYAVFAVGGLFFCLMRTNGWYSYLVIALILVPLVGWQNRKLLLVFCIVLATGWICNNPVLDALGVTETNYVEALAVPFQQISRVVVEECEIDQRDAEMIQEIFHMDKVKELYDPLTVDPIKFEAFRHEHREYLKENLGEYAVLWMRLGLRYPWVYMKAWIDETMGYWNAGYHFWIYPEGGECEELGITRPEIDNPVADMFAVLFHFEEGTPILTQPLYGIGFQVWLLFFCLIVNIGKGREEFLLAIPAVVVVVGLWVGTPVFAEFRYAYPIFVTVPVLLSLTLFETA